ncbi:MAG: hypothetical protein ABI359_01420 [Ginsengibacter sp.]
MFSISVFIKHPLSDNLADLPIAEEVKCAQKPALSLLDQVRRESEGYLFAKESFTIRGTKLTATLEQFSSVFSLLLFLLEIKNAITTTKIDKKFFILIFLS